MKYKLQSSKTLKSCNFLNLVLLSFLLINLQKCSFGNSNLVNVAPNKTVFSETRNTINQVMLKPEMIYSNCGCFGASPFTNMVDEQTAQVARSEFNLPGDKRYNKAQFVIDLKALYQLTDISIYELAGNWRGKDTVFIYTGNPAHWRARGYITAKRDKDQWATIGINDSSRFVMLEFNIKIRDIEEVVLFGTKIGEIDSIISPISSNRSLPTMDRLMGATGGLWENENLLSCVGSLREFHSWNWNDGGNDEKNYNHSIEGFEPYPNNIFYFNPDFSNRHTDVDYKRVTDKGTELNPCLQTSALYFVNGDNENNKPVYLGNDPNNPLSYKAHADYLFQYAARYGSKKVADSLLRIYRERCGNQNEFQPIVSGLNLVKSIENWNEPDKWWHPNASYFSPFQFAAMCSADYDGHEGTMGKNVGVKNADSSLKFVMGGLATLNIDYIKGMKLWSEHNRPKTKKIPVDVLNFHHYCNASGGVGQPTIGISPEQDKLKEKLKKVVEFRNKELPELEVWLSEFGYDTNEGSTQVSPAIGNNSTLEIQGRWLMRCFLEIAAAGIDRAFLYNFDDYGFNTPSQYLTSGLVGGAPKNEKKISWYYMACLKNILTNYSFYKELPSGQIDINVYAFKSKTKKETIYVVWCNTSSNKEIYNYKLNVKSLGMATLYKPEANDLLYSKTNIKQQENGFKIDIITELPVFIQVN
ncbi:MAG: hypothetical protein K9G64_00635 [Bacteroidia bacterium]|nr:hypothetical protein [Bacteroidia bacterium]